jgi:hypothetical protein
MIKGLVGDLRDESETGEREQNRDGQHEKRHPRAGQENHRAAPQNRPVVVRLAPR